MINKFSKHGVVMAINVYIFDNVPTKMSELKCTCENKTGMLKLDSKIENEGSRSFIQTVGFQINSLLYKSQIYTIENWPHNHIDAIVDSM